MSEVGVPDLKTRLSAYLRRVEEGETVVIMKRGRPIGRIGPVGRSTEARLDALSQAGMVAWNGEGLHLLVPFAQAGCGRTVADLLVEDWE